MPLPYIDEHSQRITGTPDTVWAAVSKVLRKTMGGSARFARILGCDPVTSTTAFAGLPGETVPGFRVVDADDHRLELRGRHRFSNYALTFVLDGDQLRAQTHAEFPGILGSLYRTAVIRTGFHRLATRRLLRQMARAA